MKGHAGRGRRQVTLCPADDWHRSDGGERLGPLAVRWAPTHSLGWEALAGEAGRRKTGSAGKQLDVEHGAGSGAVLLRNRRPCCATTAAL